MPNDREDADIPVGDAHCHLAALDDPGAAVREAIASAVSPILAVSMEPADAEPMIRLRSAHPGHVLVGVGLHPSRVVALDPVRVASDLEAVERMAPMADFVGEIGLDFKDARDAGERHRQLDALERQLAVARRHRLGVNLHTRRADRELIAIAGRFTRDTGLPALLHWFTHSAKLARVCGEQGLYISAGPSILFDPKQAAVCAAIHPDLILVETDSPVVYDGAEARPSWASRVAAALASARGEEPARLLATLKDNLRRYLGPVRPCVAAGPLA